MESVTNVETIASKENVRKSLQVLQPAATDKETLVRADRILRCMQQSKERIKKDVTFKTYRTKTKKSAPKCKKVTSENKATQTAREEKIIIKIEDLTSTVNPGKNYWQVLAERREMNELVDALEENKKLLQHVQEGNKKFLLNTEKLREECHICKEMLDETRTLIEELREEMIGNDRNDI
ncbi:unnamed protein product [Lasius platythorax]|uniref:Geminin n=1 Tax=Lasius platythorax TaxID=488582 RepID=A0AAV2NQD4_9HYME